MVIFLEIYAYFMILFYVWQFYIIIIIISIMNIFYLWIFKSHLIASFLTNLNNYYFCRLRIQILVFIFHLRRIQWDLINCMILLSLYFLLHFSFILVSIMFVCACFFSLLDVALIFICMILFNLFFH